MNQTQQGITGTGWLSTCVVVGCGIHCVIQLTVSVGKSSIIVVSVWDDGQGKTKGGMGIAVEVLDWDVENEP